VAAYLVWGLVTGLLIWIDWLVLPYVAAAGIVLLLAGFSIPQGRRSELFGLSWIALMAGVVAGAAPMVRYNLNLVDFQRDNAFAVFRDQNRMNGAGDSYLSRVVDRTPARRQHFGDPTAWACAPRPRAGRGSVGGRCVPDPARGRAVVFALGLRRAILAGRDAPAVHPASRTRWYGRVRHRYASCRAGAGGAAAASLAAYVHTPWSWRHRLNGARLPSCVAISWPALLWPLWSGTARCGDGPGALRCARWFWRPLAAIVATMLFATASRSRRCRTNRRSSPNRTGLVATLDRLGITRFYSDYWSCYVVVFASNEQASAR